jgi:anaerobic selenocysteine-containing dehydrogenase
VQTHHRACNLCEAICGLQIKVAGEQILSIKGDKQDPLSRGHICPKAVALQDLHNDPDRLRQPVRRRRSTEGEDYFEPISWDEALDTVASRLVETSRRYGVDAIGIYMGNPSVHNYGMMTHQGNLFRHFRTRNRFSATSVDQLPHHLVSLWLFGHKLLLPIPDIDRTDYFLMLGANPMASNGSLWTVPDFPKRSKALRARGAKLVVVDPRRSETAAVASEHIAIKPGTDALWLSALLNCLFEEKLVRLRHLADFTQGLSRVEDALGDLTAENVAHATGIAASATRRIARELAAADAGICYGRMGVSTQRFGALCQWLIQLINIATGNLDRAGGSLFTSPALDQLGNLGRGGFARARSRVRNLPEFDRELPAVAMAEEILTEGPGQIRALFTGAGNPVLSTPNGRQLDTALGQLDFMVSLDPYINETTRHADIILPPTSPLEHDHFDITFHLFATRNTVRFNTPVFDRPPGALHDWEIFSALGERVAALLGVEANASLPPDQLIDLGLQAGPYGQAQGSEHALSLARLAESPSGIDLGPLRSQLPERLFTIDKMIHCDAELPLADLQRLRESQREITAANELLLIGRRHVRSNNSWMHNFHRLVKGKDRCTLQMHPADLNQRQLADGDRVTVSSRVGELQVKVESSTDMLPGVVSLPHGWGHNRRGIRMQIAMDHAGVSCNDLTDELAIDELSGNAAVNAVPVRVRAAVPERRPESE